MGIVGLETLRLFIDDRLIAIDEARDDAGGMEAAKVEYARVNLVEFRKRFKMLRAEHAER